MLGEVAEDARLVAVLPAAHEEQVVLVQLGRTRADGQHLDIDAAPSGPLHQGADVADVAVDVHGVGVEVPDAQGPAHDVVPTGSDQKARAAPLRSATRRSSSIAV